MPPFVVALAPEETGLLTLDEWDRLRSLERVVFEEAGHPLADRLNDAGVETVVRAGGPEGDEAVVLDPTSPRLLELARAGFEVSVGPASPPDPLSAAYAAPIARRAAASVADLAAIMARLRSPDGCPWDREQSHESLRVHLIEEAHEVLEAIDRDQLGAELEDELGDVLLQVAFHAQLAAEDGRFDLAGVADRIVEKLLRRHPHVFGEIRVSSAGEVVRNWETLKAQERDESGPFDGVPGSLPALSTAYKVQKRAAGLGFEPDHEEVAAKALASLKLGIASGLPDDVGDALFWLVALARSSGVDPEGALRKAVVRFRARYE
ncbi:MAG: nucleoside triphosphate pyrophosphohydrolase [Actinobacteria bacterium]|nr:nucleoside triphosphate pyrophosphohydrolase [Actinomycetota bacterium]